LLLDPLILVGSILHLIVVYYLIRFGILAEIVGLQKIRISKSKRDKNMTMVGLPCLRSSWVTFSKLPLSLVGYIWAISETWTKCDLGACLASLLSFPCPCECHVWAM
ncbi:hypothetical protein PIB30_092843, partial [Stylosanthes scabra]|nr:hypothetical protein [Stylosanthes scabra]